MKKICVYSGSNTGVRSEYKEIAIQLGNVLVQNNIELVYGGSKVGLMGEIANQILKNNGKVTGVIPKSLFPKEIINDQLSRLIEVKDMHERKKTMADLSDGFIALPGGIGTFEELFEVLSWAQLGIHKKPVGVLNVSNFFDPLITLMQNAAKEGFMNQSNIRLLLVSTDPKDLTEKMKNYEPPALGNKWRELER
ncbi:TIGR00730 family Rossman fold protein [Clostridium algidicarnis]|uniref:LOG family protein n=1 Tax=Clostridium algidicarnis TaxID=37659 RepID=UPI001C0B0287|nr:TIGR00730 family Rossman fold protein [Clostridium algidicarnis]MBU3227779.1 TIGR00730 family Rossman fold protein [Clostridium algidicarnis]MBU3251531.1 TIGR00730 family Rossman fold protein [Clostridium algidicarnis]